MFYAIYLDDERDPKSFSAPNGAPWIVCRNKARFFRVLKVYGPPSYVSFDHDLGENEDDGYKIVKLWCLKASYGEHYIPKGFTFNVHSANPVGAKNIQCYLDNFLEHYWENSFDR